MSGRIRLRPGQVAVVDDEGNFVVALAESLVGKYLERGEVVATDNPKRFVQSASSTRSAKPARKLTAAERRHAERVANETAVTASSGDDRNQQTPAPAGTSKGAEMASNDDAPKPGRGYTVVELRSTHQAEIVKLAAKGSPAGSIKVSDRYVTVKNTDAQAVVDKVIAAGRGDVGIFDRRVLDYFVAVLMLRHESLVDSRNSLHARMIAVGRQTKGFRFGMKLDGTLEVFVGSRLLGTQKTAMAELAPDQLTASKAKATAAA